MPRGPKDKTGVSFSPRVPEANPRRLCLVAFNPLMKLLRTLGVGTGFARYTLRSGAGALGRWIHRRCVGGGIVPARVVIVAHDQPPLGADHTKQQTHGARPDSKKLSRRVDAGPSVARFSGSA